MPTEKSTVSIDRQSVVQTARDIRAVFHEHVERLHAFRHYEYAGFDIERDGDKYIAAINYLVNENDFDEESPPVVKIGRITVDLDDILSLPEKHTARQQAISDFVHYVIERDSKKQRAKEIDTLIASVKKRIDEMDKEIAALENPATVDEKLRSFRRTKEILIGDVKRCLAEKKNVQEQIEKFSKYVAAVSEEEPPKIDDPETSSPEQ